MGDVEEGAKAMIWIGIDPGAEGAVARVYSIQGKLDISVWDTPEDPRELARLLKFRVFGTAMWDGVAHVVIEDTISVPHATKSGTRVLPASDKALHVSLGVWIGCLAARSQNFQLVHPKTWKAAMLSGVANDDQAEALALERRLLGNPEVFRMVRGPKGGLKPGRVDAIFLALYGKALGTMKGDGNGHQEGVG